MPHRCVLVLLPAVRRMSDLRMRPSRDEFRALAAEHTVVPVWTEVLADLETPVAAYAKLVGSGSGFLLESVEHGERWSRYSFVGRDPVATLELRDGLITTFGNVPASVPLDRGMLAALDELLRVFRAPIIPDLPPLQSGVMGYLGYDIVREVERLPERTARRPSVPRRGDERDRVAGGLRPLAPTGVLDRERAGTRHGHRRARPGVRRGDLPRRTRRRRSRPAVGLRPGRTTASRRPAARRSQLDGQWRLPTGGRGRQGATSSPATSSRSCCRSATTSTSKPTRSTSTECCARSIRARTCTSCSTPTSPSSAVHRSRWFRSSVAR